LFSYIRQASDSIGHLPQSQRSAVEKACKDIEWLLEDEITSALRHQTPITEENLDLIARHISCSDNKNCISQKKYFNFVTGLDTVSNHCLPMFIVELEENTTLDLKRIGKYYCVVANPAIEEESDVEPGVLQQVKERAKITRKGLGHRRSHSDFTSERHKGIVQKMKLREEKKKPRKRANSWPLFFDKANADTNFIYGLDQHAVISGQTQPFPFWELDEFMESEEMLSVRSQLSSNSKGNSSASPYPPYESRELFQRSISFSEQNKAEKYKVEFRKRYNSLPNITNKSGKTLKRFLCSLFVVFINFIDVEFLQ